MKKKQIQHYLARGRDNLIPFVLLDWIYFQLNSHQNFPNILTPLPDLFPLYIEFLVHVLKVS